MIKKLLNTLGAGTVFLFACNSFNSQSIQTDFVALGDSLVLATVDTLSSTLQKQVALKGFEQAVFYCNLEAENLTTIAGSEATFIKRAALKTRSKANNADNLEHSQIQYFQDLIDKGMPLKSKLIVENTGKVHYFKPILIQPFCLNCHGEPKKEITPNTLAAIKNNYPEDEATGYKTGGLRGLWHLTFEPFEKKK